MTTRSAAGAFLLSSLLTFASCREAEPFPYLRLDGPAPEGTGRTSLVFFWSRTCPPCVEELPEIVAFAAKPIEGLPLTLVVEDPTLTALPSSARNAPGVTIAHDPEGRLAGALRVHELPATVLVVDGRLVARFDGARRWSSEAARTAIARLAASSTGGLAR